MFQLIWWWMITEPDISYLKCYCHIRKTLNQNAKTKNQLSLVFWLTSIDPFNVAHISIDTFFLNINNIKNDYNRFYCTRETFTFPKNKSKLLLISTHSESIWPRCLTSTHTLLLTSCIFLCREWFDSETQLSHMSLQSANAATDHIETTHSNKISWIIVAPNEDTKMTIISYNLRAKSTLVIIFNWLLGPSWGIRGHRLSSDVRDSF